MSTILKLNNYISEVQVFRGHQLSVNLVETPKPDYRGVADEDGLGIDRLKSDVRKEKHQRRKADSLIRTSILHHHKLI